MQAEGRILILEEVCCAFLTNFSITAPEFLGSPEMSG